MINRTESDQKNEYDVHKITYIILLLMMSGVLCCGFQIYNAENTVKCVDKGVLAELEGTTFYSPSDFQCEPTHYTRLITEIGNNIIGLAIIEQLEEKHRICEAKIFNSKIEFPCE